MKTATLVRKLTDFTGAARLYELSEPIAEHKWNDDEPDVLHNHVVVSATRAMLTGPETYIFPADAKGNVVDWGELEGSYRGGLSHEKALENAGYEVQP